MERQTRRVRGDDALFWKGKRRIYPFLWNVEAWNKDAFTWATLLLLSCCCCCSAETIVLLCLHLSLSLSLYPSFGRPSVLKSLKQSVPLREPKPIKTPINLRAAIYCKAAAPPVGRFLRYDSSRRTQSSGQQESQSGAGTCCQPPPPPSSPPCPYRHCASRPSTNPIIPLLPLKLAVLFRHVQPEIQFE